MTSSSPGKKIPFGLTQQSFALYKEYLQSFARLSGLFSGSDRAYIPYRFVENLFSYRALIYGDAHIYDNAQVYNDAQVYGGGKDTNVFGAEVYGDAEVYDEDYF